MIQVTEISTDAFDSLTNLLDERRRMIKRHERARRHPSRQKMSLAEKLEADSVRKTELKRLNQRIDDLMNEGRSE